MKYDYNNQRNKSINANPMKVKVTIKATVFLEYSDEEKEISVVVDKEVADKRDKREES